MKFTIVLAWLPLAPAMQSAGHGNEFSARMGELVELARSGENEPALVIGDELLEPNAFTRWRGSLAGGTGAWSEAAFDWLDAPLRWAGFETRTARDRGAVQLARGVLLDRLQRPDEALEACREARLLAGPGGTRLDATYDLGCLALQEGEGWRAQIPELSGASGATGATGAPPLPTAAAPGGPGMPGAPPVPGAQGEQPDPLEAARAAYLRAREHFVERLRADWQDGDTRANAELTLRRLRELAQVEQQREEQEQEQDQDQEQQQDQQQEGDSEEQQDSESQDSDSEDEQQSEENSDESESSEDQSDESEESSEEEQESENPDDSEQEQQAEGEPSEQELTREEVQRLLQRLSEHEKEGEELRSRIRRLRRVPVERDW